MAICRSQSELSALHISISSSPGKVFDRIRARTKVEERGLLEIDAQNRAVVKKKRENEAKNTCCYAEAKIDGDPSAKTVKSFLLRHGLPVCPWVSFPELGPKPNIHVYRCRFTPLAGFVEY
jgi:hypothetical protein